jgi:DNA-binding NarL/FixJ family response regulator
LSDSIKGALASGALNLALVSAYTSFVVWSSNCAEGSQFKVKLAAEALLQSAYPDGLTIPSKNYPRRLRMSRRLLIVDDESHLLRALEAYFGTQGFEVTTARSGAEALVKLAQTLPDLIISDIRMPGMSGYELARQLRDSSRTALVPIVFLTAKGESADRIEGFRTDVDAYVTKPFVPDELQAVVSNILRRVERTHLQIAKMIGRSEKEDAHFHDESLTETENKIANSVARGLSNKEIAAEMQISFRTVENHISHILDKKHFNNRVEIARYVLENR